MRFYFQKTPFVAMWGVLLAGIALTLIAVSTALHQPWFGFSLKPQNEHVVVDVIHTAPSGVQRAQAVHSIASADGHKLARLTTQDVMEDPDQLETYQQSRQFFARQHDLASMLQQPQISMQFADGASMVLPVQASRPLASLPLVFWVQILVGLSSFLIGGWVWGISRTRYTTFILFIAGCCIMAASFAAAIYSTRMIALPAPLFEMLSNLNHSGAILFCTVLVILFCNYPHKLVPRAVQIAFSLLMSLWWLCDMFKVFFSGSPMGAFMPILIGLVSILLLSWLQYRKATYDPVAQAALRWFALSIALGAGIPIVLMALPSLFGMNAAMPQGYAFLFFLLIYVGVVQGVTRYKLFELEGWTFRILFYLVGAFLLVLLDALLIFATAIDHAPAFGLSVLALAVVYLPLRDMLARRFTRRKPVDREQLFQQVVNISLPAGNADSNESWQLFLKQVFEVLHVQSYKSNEHFALPAQPEIKQEGVLLIIPAVGHLSAISLQYAAGGRRLFSASDVALATELCSMLQYALQARQAYEQGAIQERSRIGRDLHDNIGAQLLTALQSRKQDYKDYMITETLTDLRHIINNAMRGGVLLEELAIELRRETAERCEAAGLQLNWSFSDDRHVSISAPQLHAIRSVIREAVSNTIRYAQATQLAINIQTGQNIFIQIQDDGIGLNAQQQRTGYGLHSMQARVSSFKGSLDMQSSDSGLSLYIQMPWQAVVAD